MRGKWKELNETGESIKGYKTGIPFDKLTHKDPTALSPLALACLDSYGEIEGKYITDKVRNSEEKEGEQK